MNTKKSYFSPYTKILKIIIIFLFILNLTNLFAFVRKTSDLSKGPLYGKNMYIPYMIYYNFPGLRATGGKKFEFQYHISLYYTNDFHIDIVLNKYGYLDYVIRHRDYESLNIELGTSFYILKNLQVGMDMRLISYYGGFLDNIIETFHSAFGFPNGGREFSHQNQVHINISNNNNVDLSLERSTVSFGDIDLWVKYTFFQRRWISLAAVGAFKIPSGRISEISGSGYPDFAIGILGDFKPVWILSLYLQAGLVVPFDSFLQCVDSKPYPMFNGLVGVELNPTDFFSLVVQFNIRSSPLKCSIEYSNSYIGNTDYLSLPQINTLVGFIFRYKGYKWQFYVEEDSFTNAGVDITFNLMFLHSIKGL